MNKKELINFNKNHPCKHLKDNQCEFIIKTPCIICKSYKEKE